MENNNLTKKERKELKRQEKMEKTLDIRKNKKVKAVALWSAVFAVLIIGIGGIVYLAAKGAGGGDEGQTASLILAEDDWIKGQTEAKAVLVEYSDFQCPACAYFMPVLEKLSRDFPNDLKIIYRHFPLPQHKNAKLAAYAAEAAGQQRKFFEMADMIFEKQTVWSNFSNSKAKELFIDFAKNLELNTEQFENDIENDDIKKSDEDDYKSGDGLKI